MLGVAHGYWTLTYAIVFLTGPVSSNSGSCSEVAMGSGSAGSGRVGLTSSACVLVRGGADEATGEVLPARVVAERAGWCAALTREMTTWLLKEHWNPCDHAIPGRKLPGKRAQTLDLAHHARHASVRHS